MSPPCRLGLFVCHVHGVDLIQMAGLDLFVGLLEARAHSKQHGGRNGADGQDAAHVPAEGFLEVVALDRRARIRRGCRVS